MTAQIKRDEPRSERRPSRFAIPRVGWLGMFVLPLALLVYLIAIPIFALVWLIEWFLPLSQAGSDFQPEGNSLAPRSVPAQDSP